MRKLLDWWLARDGSLRATRRAARTAIVMPVMFAFGSQVIGNADVATFAAFGSFAMLLLADFGGTRGERLAAQASLVAVGCVLIPVATLVSRNAWLATSAMFVVGFLVLFAGVVSSTLAAASTSDPAQLHPPRRRTGRARPSIPDRVLGWLLAGVVSLPAVTLLWPAPRIEPLRDAAADACRQLSARLTAEVARMHGEEGEDVETAVARSDAAVARLRTTFLATPYRPSGLTTATRAVVRLVDELVWLSVILDDTATMGPHQADPTVRDVKSAAAVLLDHAGKELSLDEPPQDSLQDHLDDLARARRAMGVAALDLVQPPHESASAEGIVALLGPSYRAQELCFAVTAIAENIAITTAAERALLVAQVLGRPPGAWTGPIASAQQRALAHVEPHSVWLRNSVRGAVALAGAVLIANLSGAQHSVLDRARHPLGPPVQRAQHRPERGPWAGRYDDRVRHRRCLGAAARHEHPAPVGGAPCRDPGRRHRAGGLVRGGSGRVHGRPADPVQHHQPGRMAGRSGPRRGRGDRLRGQPGGRDPLLAEGRHGSPAPGPDRGVRRVRGVPARPPSRAAPPPTPP